MLLIVIPQDWKSVGDALAANFRLRSLHVHYPFDGSGEFFKMIDGLRSNITLTEVSIEAPKLIETLNGMYRVSDTYSMYC